MYIYPPETYHFGTGWRLLMADKKAEKKELTFLDHLEALRWHLIRSAIVIAVCACTLFFFNDFVFDQVIFGPKRPDFITYRAFCYLSHHLFGNDSLCMGQQTFNLINTDLSGQFTKHIWVSLVSGMIVSFPYVLWELWRFVKPALRGKEIKTTRGFVFIASLLFLTGVLFAYFIMAPLMVNFLGTYQASKEVTNLIDWDSYISIVTTTVLATGIIFELPILVFFLTQFGILSPRFMRKYRRHAIVIILIVAAIITPSPDVTSQLLVAFPLYALYEISIFVSVSVERKQKKRMEAKI